MSRAAPPGSSWIQTSQGVPFDPLNPRAEDILIEDIAHALSNVCRFGGHCKKFYSVAEHSYWVSTLVPPEHALQALLHDASEAYLGDVPSPMKRTPTYSIYRAREAHLQGMIYTKYGLSPEEHVSVKNADLEMLATEARDLLAPLHPDWRIPGVVPSEIIRIDPMSPAEAREAFLGRFRALVAERDARGTGG
jgi:hypothetical protein